MVIFQKFPILHNNQNFQRKREIFCAVCATFRVFGPARPGCARSFKTNAIPSLFRVFLVPRDPFSATCEFALKMRKCGILDSLADFSFFVENPDFRENGRMAETSIIPKEYQWFWRVDGPENA